MFEYPPQEDKNAKSILFLRGMRAMERCMAAGLVHPDSHFRNIIYDPVTLQLTSIDIEGYTSEKPQDISMDASLSKWFGYSDLQLLVGIDLHNQRSGRTTLRTGTISPCLAFLFLLDEENARNIRGVNLMVEEIALYYLPPSCTLSSESED